MDNNNNNIDTSNSDNFTEFHRSRLSMIFKEAFVNSCTSFTDILDKVMSVEDVSSIINNRTLSNIDRSTLSGYITMIKNMRGPVNRSSEVLHAADTTSTIQLQPIVREGIEQRRAVLRERIEAINMHRREDLQRIDAALRERIEAALRERIEAINMHRREDLQRIDAALHERIEAIIDAVLRERIQSEERIQSIDVEAVRRVSGNVGEVQQRRRIPQRSPNIDLSTNNITNDSGNTSLQLVAISRGFREGDLTFIRSEPLNAGNVPVFNFFPRVSLNARDSSRCSRTLKEIYSRLQNALEGILTRVLGNRLVGPTCLRSSIKSIEKAFTLIKDVPPSTIKDIDIDFITSLTASLNEEDYHQVSCLLESDRYDVVSNNIKNFNISLFTIDDEEKLWRTDKGIVDTVANDGEKECAICLTNIPDAFIGKKENNTPVFFCHCKEIIFCGSCIIKDFCRNNVHNCPYCRYEYFGSDISIVELQ